MNLRNNKNIDMGAFNLIHDYSWGFAKTRIIMTSFELEIYEAIELGFTTSIEIANYLNCNKEGIRMLLSALESMNILQNKNNSFSIIDSYKKYVLKKSKFYIGYMWKVYEKLNWDTWKNLTKSIKKGEPANKIFTYDQNKIWNIIIPYLDSLAHICANEIVDTIPIDKNLKGTILDVGCGSGIYSKEILDNFEYMTGIGIDQKNIINQLKNKESYLNNRMKVMDGNILELSFGQKKYDIVILSNIVHGYSYSTNLKLIAKCHKALKKGGILIINDFFSRKGNDLFASLFNLHSFLIGDGKMFSIDEIKNMLYTCGITTINVKKLSGPFTLIYSFV